MTPISQELEPPANPGRFNGVREFNLIKTRLIRFLHERLGFDAVIFESGLLECHLAERAAMNVDASGFMRLCVAPVWHTREVVELFDYIKSTKTTEHPIIVGGMDSQPSSFAANRRRTRWIQKVVATVDTALAHEVVEVDSAFATLLLGRREPLVQFARSEPSPSEFYDKLATLLARQEGGESDDLKVVRQAARATANLIRQFSATDTGREHAIRDSAMTDNLQFLLDSVYPGRKAVVWAHNTHVAKDVRGMIRVDTGREEWSTGVGSLLAQSRGDQMYSIGLYMVQGRIADNYRREFDVSDPAPGSLEWLLAQGGGPYTFLNLAGMTRTRSTEWIFQPILARHAGRHDFRLVLADQFDGILSVGRVSPPEYCVREPAC